MNTISSQEGDVQWSDEISLDGVDYIVVGPPCDALISVMFKCVKCDRRIVVSGVELPMYAMGRNEDYSRVWGESVDFECDCGAEYEVYTDSSCAGWDVEIERLDVENSPKNKPSSFRYRVDEDFAADEDFES